MGPMRPACQKWMSDLASGLVRGVSDLIVKGARVPANSRAFNPNSDLTFLETFARLDALKRRP